MTEMLYTVEKEGWLRKLLPCEDIDQGLYIHPGSVVLLGTTRCGQESEEESQVWVSAPDFMTVQKERDELRKLAGLLNSIIRGVPLGLLMSALREGDARRAYRLLDEAGFHAADAEAMDDLVAWATREPS